tara:strand:+ start:5531 stop:6136 length:606 start_codon:yes stop_codon:yes gene_type:complete
MITPCLDSLLFTDYAIIEIGVGPYKRRIKNSITVDILPGPDVDIVSDIFDFLQGIPDSSIKEIHSFHFLEHIVNLELLLREFSRVLQPSGVMQHSVPHFSNPYFYSDPTHSRTFGLYTFSYFFESCLFSRHVPKYHPINGVALTKIRLKFRSVRPRYILHIFKNLAGSFFNLHPYFLEIYEESFCWLFPCYEISYLCTKKL